MKPWLGWGVRYLLWASGIIAGAVVIAVLLYTVPGSLTHPHLPLGLRAAKGFQAGLTMGSIWGIGPAMVFCVMQWYRQRRRKEAADGA